MAVQAERIGFNRFLYLDQTCDTSRPPVLCLVNKIPMAQKRLVMAVSNAQRPNPKHVFELIRYNFFLGAPSYI